MLTTGSKKILIMAGGTGGHIFPALSIAEKLLQKGALVEWLGAHGGLETDIISGTDIPLHLIAAKGVRGRGLRNLLVAPFMIIQATWQALKVISQVNPDCVLGMGGFATGPGGVAAKLKGKKLVIHEQNAVPGVTNKLLRVVADHILEAFPHTFTNRKRVVVTGNPIRDSVLDIAKEKNFEDQTQRPLRILILGGSQGARAINEIIAEVLSGWANDTRPEVVHQTGKKNLEDTLAIYQRQGIGTDSGMKVLGFLENIAEYFDWADIVIGRSGASTVCELAVAGLPSILIPYPFHKDQQQSKNANWLAAAGAAVVIEQTQLTDKGLGNLLVEFDSNREKLSAMSSAARKLAEPDASEKIAEICLGTEHD